MGAAEFAAREQAVALLEGSHDYRVLRRFVPRDSYGAITSDKVGHVLFVDFETTGVEIGKDGAESTKGKPIEIGAALVEYDKKALALGRVVGRYNGFEDPGTPIPEHIQALTGITDADVAGKCFDDARVNALVDRAVLIVAHNAWFDREVGERRFRAMAAKCWGCSMSDVPWADLGVASTKLDYVAMRCGMFHDGHRAAEDAELLAALLTVTLESGNTGLEYLISRARTESWRVWASEAEYRYRGVLKGRGYVWCDGAQYSQKAWRIETTNKDAELAFLRDNVLGRNRSVLVEKIGFNNRFTERVEERSVVTL